MGIGNTQIYADLAKDLHRLGGSYGCCCSALEDPGLSSLGVPGVPWHPQILADELTLSQPEGGDYSRLMILAPPDFQTFLRPWDRLHSGVMMLQSSSICH